MIGELLQDLQEDLVYRNRDMGIYVVTFEGSYAAAVKIPLQEEGYIIISILHMMQYRYVPNHCTPLRL